MNKFLLVIVLCLSLNAFSQGTNYYVSNTGNDSNNGLSEQTPWKTLDKVNAIMSSLNSGDVISFNGGDEFFGVISLINKNGITLTSYGSGKAIIKGSKPLIGWTKTSGNIWEVSTGLDNVYNALKNNVGTVNARIPNLKTPEDDPTNFLNITSVQNVNTQFSCTNLIGHADLTGATVYITMIPEIRSRQIIKAFDSGTGKITLAGDINGTYNLSKGKDFWIQNHFNLLTEEDEWYYDKGASKLYLYSVGSPTGITATTNNSVGIKVTNSNSVRLDNLIIRDFDNRGVFINSSDFFTLNNCELGYIRGNAIRTIGSNNGSYKNNYIHNISSSAIKLEDSDSNLIEDNLIEDIYMLKNSNPNVNEGTSGIWMSFHSARNIIRYNTFKNIGFNGIYSSGSKDFVIDKNYLENCGLSLQDGGSIYAHNKLGDGSRGTITNNIVIGHSFLNSERNFNSIYNDDDSHDITVTGNSLKGNNRGIYSHNNINNTYNNNNVYKPFSLGIYIKNDAIGQEVAELAFDGNEIYTENSSDMCLRLTNNEGSNIKIGTFDNNKYFNTLSEDVVSLNNSSESTDNTISEWQTKSSQDKNSIDDSRVTIKDSHFAYNKAKTAKNISIPSGTWNDLDGKRYNGSISLQPFTSKILIFSEDQSNTINASAGSDQSICQGDKVTLTATGGSGYTWSNGATTQSITESPNSTQTYTVTVTDGSGNSDTDDVIVTVNSVTANAGADVTINEGDSATLTASGGESYLWNTGATTESITVSPNSTNTYTVTVTKNGCEDTDDLKVVVNPVEITNPSYAETSPVSDEIPSMTIYPNPSDGIVNIRIDNLEEDFNIFINDSKGSLIYHERSKGHDNYTKDVDLSKFTDGIYFVRLLSKDKNLVKTLIII